MLEAGATAELRYPYRVKLWVVLLAGSFFALAGVVLVDAARTNNRGMIINRLIELDKSDTTIFLWVLVAASLGFVLIALALLWQRFARERHLVVGPDMVIVPNMWRQDRDSRFAYADVQALKRQSVQRQHFLTVEHAGGKTLINASLLPSRADFETVCDAVAVRVLATRTV